MAEVQFLYVAYFNDRRVQTGLNLLRYLVKPTAKREAHVTARGPYSEQLDDDKARICEITIDGAPVSIGAPGTFYSSRHSVVYLSCESDALKSVWHKEHYGYTPHITIYSGKNREQANDILEALTKAQNASANITCSMHNFSEMYTPSIRNDLTRQLQSAEKQYAIDEFGFSSLLDIRDLPWNEKMAGITGVVERLRV